MKKKIAWLGLGNMGEAMARRLVDAGHEVTVYNRTAKKADPMVAAGAKLARTPREAVAQADMMFTMLRDDAALEEVMTGPEGALDALPKGAIHISMSTISPLTADKLSSQHQEHGSKFIACPVLGRPQAAAAGQLFLLAAGPGDVIKDCEIVLMSLGQKIIRLGEQPGHGHLTKVLANFMLISVIETLSEAIAVARKSGLNEQQFLDALTGTVFGAPVYQNYGKMIVDQNYEQKAGFKVPLALKDVKLALSSAEAAGGSLPVASVIQEKLLRMIAGGQGELDMSALGRLAAQNIGLEG